MGPAHNSVTARPALIDAHQHFWTRDSGDYLPGDYLRDAAGLDIRGSVFAECHTNYDRALPADLQSVGETRFIAELGAQRGTHGLAGAIIAFADPLAETPFDDILARHIAVAGGRLRSVRRSVAWDEDPSLTYAVLRTRDHMLADPRFEAALHALAARDLMFETWLYHTQIDELTALARKAPDCTIVLNHAGTALAGGAYAGREDVWPNWRVAMARLSACANVHVKIGGFVTPGMALDPARRALGLERWTAPALAEALAPALSHLLDTFGPERCVFESNFPIDKAACDFGVLVDAYAAALPAHTHAAVFHDNAARLYRLQAR